MAAASSSPASSPRLPSPPPIAEDQIGPTSPGHSLYEDHGKLTGLNNIDTGAARRIRPGTKAEDMAEGPPLVELQDIDSAFQLTEHLKAMYVSYTRPPNSDVIVPVTADQARKFSQPPPNTSKEIWLYELARFLIQKTNAMIVGLFADSPPCSQHSCPEMRASEWQYLCAVHDPPKSCAAIDYSCHTLDWAATALTNSKMFPSRLGLGSGNVAGGNDKVLQQQMKEITNIFRRVYRIFAHAWFQHREMFWRVESKTGLYVFFKTVCDEYGMIQPENYTIPAEAEGREPELTSLDQPSQPMITLLKRETGGDQSDQVAESVLPEVAGRNIASLGDTTKRHRHTRSDIGSSLTTAIKEEAEEDETGPAKPGFERQSTALRDPEGRDRTESKSELETEPAPTPIAETADTIEPSSPDLETNASDVTVIGPEPDEATPETPEHIEIMDPVESPAAAGQEADKSVAD